jgi:hypothetical protein
MVMAEEQDKPPEARTRRALIEVVTENGFSIARTSDEDERAPRSAREYRFIVSSPNELEREVVVEFDPAAVTVIQRKRRSPLTRASLFWISCAERSLAAYLWERNHLPPGGRLRLEEMSFAEMEIARRWDHGLSPRIEIKPRNSLKTGTLGQSFYIQSIIAVLFLYFIAVFAPKILASDLTYLRGLLSNLILYAAIFLSGALVGLAVSDLTSANDLLNMSVANGAKVEDRMIPPSYDEQGLTPIERVIHKK